MRRSCILLTAVVLICAPPVRSQQPQAASELISGSWGFDGRTLLELKAEASGAVSGNAYYYGGPTRTVLPIKQGAFDAATGALTLTGEIALPGTTSPSVWTTEGTLANGTLQVTFALGASRLPRTLTRVPVAVAAGTQTAPGTVLITGANRGLGFEFAKQYAERGWTVVATVRNPRAATELQELSAKTGKITIEQLDLLDRPAIAAFASRYKGIPIDVLINNAGIGGDVKGQTLGSFDYGVFEEAMAVNVYGALAMAEAFAASVGLSRDRKIVSVASGWGILGLPRPPGPYFYRASKVALNMVMHALAADLQDEGVIVALVAPGAADTELRRQLQGNSDAPPAAQPVAAMIKVIDGLTMANSGTAINFDGTVLPW
jgi:NAD(P)-dependent dehydrogenase (short-subunit alcohol dehydrogenase family)